MDRVRTLADRLIGLSAALGSVSLMLIVVVILIDVIGRGFGKPLYGGQDITTMAGVIVVLAPMALCDRFGGHISVDLFERYFPDGMNRAIDIFVAVLGAIIFATLALATWQSAKLSLLLNLSTNLLYIPKAWFQWAGVAFMCLAALGLALRAVELTVTGRDVRKEPNS